MALPPGIKVTFVDRPELSETFADSLETFTFNNNLLRVDLCSIRLEAPEPPKPATAKKYPVARLVMPLDAAVDLFNKLNQVFGALEKTGAIKRESGGSIMKPPSGQSH